ncbi:MAG: LysM peptidoglycan-binding domain-containing protein [Luteolibacter sp.]
MKVALWISAACAFPFILVSCGNGGGKTSGGGSQQPGIGPFDSQGRYREEWADNPSQWRRPGGSSSSRVTKTDDVPEVAQNEQPPLNSVPLATSSPKPVIAETKPKTTSKKESEAVVVKTRPLNTSEREAVAGRTTKSKAEPEVTVKRKTKPTTEVVKAKTKPKTTVKAKPKTTVHVVKPGDSLSSIASRYGCSVSALKSANGISGTLIRDGRTLTIPRK